MPLFSVNPHHQHDCAKCVYIGTAEMVSPKNPDEIGLVGIFANGEVYDVYLACEHSMYKYIVRFGDYGDYITVGEHSTFWELCEKMAEAYHQRGYRLEQEIVLLKAERDTLMEQVYRLTTEIENKKLAMKYPI